MTPNSRINGPYGLLVRDPAPCPLKVFPLVLPSRKPLQSNYHNSAINPTVCALSVSLEHQDSIYHNTYRRCHFLTEPKSSCHGVHGNHANFLKHGGLLKG